MSSVIATSSRGVVPTLDAMLSRLSVDGLTLLDVVQEAEIQGFQVIAARLRWSCLHPEESDNGGRTVVAAIRMRHEGLKKLGRRGFDVAQDCIALPFQQSREGPHILRLACQGNLQEA